MPLLLLNAEKEVPQLVVNKILKLLSLKVSRNFLLTEVTGVNYQSYLQC